MLIGDILLALVLGSLFATVFGLMTRSRKGVPGGIPIFIVFFLFAWAGGLWLRPVGPPLFGMYWVPGLILVTLIFLLLAALTQIEESTRNSSKTKYITVVTVGTVFWFLIAALLVAVIIGYLL